MADKTVTVRPSGGDYTTLAAAVSTEAGINSDLTAAGMNGMLYFKIEGDWSGGEDTTVVDFDGYTTDATHYIKVYTDASNRASTTWSTSKYVYQITDANAFLVREDYIWIDGLQIELIGQTTTRFFFQNIGRTAGNIKLSNSVYRGDGGAQKLWLYVVTTGNFADVNIWNCIFYNWGSNSDTYLDCADAGTVINMYNCTVISTTNNIAGVRQEGGTLTMKNCYSGGNTSGRDYFGTITMVTCASSDTTGDVDNIAVNTTNFTDVTIDGGENWALPAGSGLIGVGTDSVYADAATDINGETRTSTWDIGADEYVAAAGGVSIPIVMQYFAMQRAKNAQHNSDDEEGW